MGLHVYRSNRVEHLVDALGEVLGALWRAPGADPMARVPVVVGSRGMDRWLRHELATRFGVAAGLVFPFPRQAYADAARHLLAMPGATWPPPAPPRAGPRWEPDPLAFRVLAALRARAGQPEVGPVDRYLAGEPRGEGAPVGRRELALAREVADVLDGLMHEHPELALAWARAPKQAPPRHRWLADLLADLGVAEDGPVPSPPWLHERLEGAAPEGGPFLAVFGLSTLGAGDRARIQALARALDLHLFLLAPASGYWGEVRREAVAPGADNPVLADLGGPSRDLLEWVAELAEGEHELPFYAPDPSDAALPLLRRLQGWVAGAEPLPRAPWAHAPGDDSLSFHAACGPLRQCEIVRDELLRAFAADPTLDARDVVVMTPQVETFAPLLAAVLGRAGLVVETAEGGPPIPAAPPIPTAVSDLGLRETNQVAAALLAVLDLAGERLSASRVLDLLELPAVCRRLEIGPDEAASLRELALRGGLRWGADAEERRAAGYPASAQNTLAFATERAVLGALVGDADDPPLVGPPPAPRVAPLPLRTPEDLALAGTLAAFARTLSRARARLAGPMSAPDWRDAIIEALDAVALAPAEEPWLRTEVVEALDAWVAAVGDGPSFTREALVAWLDGSFERPAGGDRPITGAVTVCALEPMRSVPFRVVVLVGMDDGVFPRQTKRPAWDPLADRELALPAPDRREADRHLLLEAVLSARDHLWVLWTGRDEHDFERRPAAVPVEALMDTVAALTGRAREEVLREHPLQPWSPRAFARPIYDPSLARAARARGAGGAGELPPWRRELPPEDHPPRTFGLFDLIEAATRPWRTLLRRRLGIFGPDEAQEPEDRLPQSVELEWAVRREVLARILEAGADREAVTADVVARLRGEGRVPDGPWGEAAARREVQELVDLAANVAGHGGTPLGPLAVQVVLGDGQLLVDEVVGVAQDETTGDARLILPELGRRASDHGRLSAWIQGLALVASGHPLTEAVVVSREKNATLALPDEGEVAAAALADLAELAAGARRRLLHLFPRTSPKLAGALAKGEEDPAALAMLANETFREGFGAVDLDDPEIADAYRGYDPGAEILARGLAAEVVELSRRVWVPVFEAKVGRR